MAHTVLHGHIDGYDVVLAFSEASIDKEATRIKVSALAVLIPEEDAVSALNQRIADRRTKLDQDFQSIFGHTPLEIMNPAEAAWYIPAKFAAQIDVDAIASLAPPLIAKVKAAREKLWQANIVYFNTGENEELVTDELYAKLLAASTAIGDTDSQLLMDGSSVPDYRGAVLWAQAGKLWTSRTIARLGDAPAKGEIVDAMVTPDQRIQIQAGLEAARIAGMTDTAKAAEIAAALSSLADQAVAMDAKAAIMGTDKTGQAWYQAQAGAVQDKYK